MKIRFSYELTPEEAMESIKWAERTVMGVLQAFTNRVQYEHVENMEKMRYSNMEAERQDKHRNHSQSTVWASSTTPDTASSDVPGGDKA